MSIKIITHTVSSNPDVYGNRYHFATFTNTETGKSYTCHVDCDSTAQYIVSRAGYDWKEVSHTSEHRPIRQWNASAKRLPYLRGNEWEQIKAEIM